MFHSKSDRTLSNSSIESQPGEFDAFISYETSINDEIQRLSSMLKDGLNLNVFLTLPDIDMSMSKMYKKLMRKLMQSKMFICCVTKNYVISAKCKDELIIAYTSMIPVLVILFEEVQYKELEFINNMSKDFEKIHAYHFYNSKGPWHKPFMNQITIFMELITGRQLGNNDINNLLLNRNANIDIINVENEINIYNEDLPVEDTVDSSIINFEKPSQSIDDINYEKIFLNPSILKLTYNNSLVQFAFGFNRIVFLESRDRFLITSSYFKSVISIDKSGRWIEKRNPCGLMKQPFAICLDKLNNIYIGDNQLKCIFVFNQFFKHLNTIGEIHNGIYDMVIDDYKGILYATILYDSIVIAIDIKKSVVVNTIHVSAPLFVSLLNTSIIILNINDTIYIVNEKTFKVRFKFQINKTNNLCALYTLRERNVIFLIGNEILKDMKKSKNVYLCVIKLENNRTPCTRKIYLEAEHVNDMVLTKNLLTCVSDTHVAVFNYKDIEGLLKWSV